MSRTLRRWQLGIWLLGTALILWCFDPEQFILYIVLTVLWSFIGPHYVGRILTHFSMPKPATSTTSTSTEWAVVGILVTVCFLAQALYNLIVWISAN